MTLFALFLYTSLIATETEFDRIFLMLNNINDHTYFCVLMQLFKLLK